MRGFFIGKNTEADLTQEKLALRTADFIESLSLFYQNFISVCFTSLMAKDFSKWHELKSYIQEHNSPLLFREREIWWCSVGANLGDEMDGKNIYFERPVLILRKFNREIFWGLPMSTKIKDNEFYFKYSFDSNEGASILLSQLRIMSSKRLIRRVITINENTFGEIREAVNKLLKNESDPIV